MTWKTQKKRIRPIEISLSFSSQSIDFFSLFFFTLLSNYAACPAYCQAEDGDCHGTCSFLREMEEKGVTPSVCPPQKQSPPAASASLYPPSFCVSSCDIDSDCDTGFLCCSVGCEKSCQRSGIHTQIPCQRVCRDM